MATQASAITRFCDKLPSVSESKRKNMMVFAAVAAALAALVAVGVAIIFLIHATINGLYGLSMKSHVFANLTQVGKYTGIIMASALALALLATFCKCGSGSNSPQSL